MEKLDCVVVGAGWYGLAAAKQFYCTQPNTTVAIFDSQSTLGGKWASEILAPGIKSNNLLGTYEYPDFPMRSDLFDVKSGQHIPGNVIHAYLNAYADAFGITDFIRLDTTVLSAEHLDTADGGWILTVKPPKGEQVRVHTRRLIIATGLLSEAFMPRFEGQDRFGGRIFHSKDFQENRDTLKTAKAVTVFGAGKSGWDAVYEYATAGIKVNWVIRSSGHGPCWNVPPYVTPFRKWIEKLANTRFLTWFSPCIWGDADGYTGIRNFFHGTFIGRFLVDCFWKVLSQDVITLNKLDSHPDTAKLKPWLSAMFAGCSYSILNYDQDFFELVRGDLVDVHVGEITHLSPGKVHLADGTQFASDVFFANVGYKHLTPVKFLPENIERELGIPHPKMATDSTPPEDDLANQHGLLERADREILRRFPRLRRRPLWNENYMPMIEQKGISVADAKDDVMRGLTPYMLHRFLVPPSPRFLGPRDTAFTGFQTNFSNAITAHISGLWISAYFSERLANNDPGAVVGDTKATSELQYETLLHNRFGKWRYPVDWGEKAPSFIFDAVPYLDLLQGDLGLKPHRKGGWLTELYDPYGPEDYRNINDEWLGKQEYKGN